MKVASPLQGLPRRRETGLAWILDQMREVATDAAIFLAIVPKSTRRAPPRQAAAATR